MDGDFVVGVGGEGHGEVEFDFLFAADDADGDRLHAADLAGLDGKMIATDGAFGDDGDEAFLNVIEIPSQGFGDHGDGFGQADVADGIGANQLAHGGDGHSGGDFLLQHVAPAAGVEGADDLDGGDVRADGGAGEGEDVHGKAGVDAGAEDDDAGFFGQGVERGGRFGGAQVGIRKLFATADHVDACGDEFFEGFPHGLRRRAGGEDGGIDGPAGVLQCLANAAADMQIGNIIAGHEVAEGFALEVGVNIDDADEFGVLRAGGDGANDAFADFAEAEMNDALHTVPSMNNRGNGGGVGEKSVRGVLSFACGAFSNGNLAYNGGFHFLLAETYMLQKLLHRIQSKSAVVGVLGLGYVGLPLVRAFTRGNGKGGVRCIGFDVDPTKISKLLKGQSYIKHIPSSYIRELLDEGKFDATTDFTRLKECDALIICVPTPLTKNRDPDMRYVQSTADAIAKHLRRGQLVVLESTTYPGTTREIVLPALEKTGKKVGKDFLLAYSPEREDPGRTDFDTQTIPKVVGGHDAGSLKAAAALYGCAVKSVVPVNSCEVAEASKILENCYRCINIAMINEMKVIFDRMGIDVWEVIAAAKTKPFGFQAFYPGPGLGGHCIPIDPFYLSWKAKRYDVTARFIELAGELNVGMPYYVISKVAEALNEKGKAIRGSKILVLGLAYKKDVDDLRESPSIVLIEQLQHRGAKVDYNDPHIPTTHKQREHDLKLKSVPLTAANLKKYDLVLISTDHSAYDYAMIVRHAKLVVDTRNATSKVMVGREKIIKA